MTKCYTLDASEESFEVLVVFLDHEIGLPGPCLHTTLEYIYLYVHFHQNAIHKSAAV